jgi:hypothetical protein
MLKIPFVLGLGVGFVLGARAGRERYDQIVRIAQRTKDNPTVAQAAGAVAHRGEDAFKEAKNKVVETVADKAPDWVPGSSGKSNGAPHDPVGVGTIGNDEPERNRPPNMRAHPEASVPGMGMPGAAPSKL